MYKMYVNQPLYLAWDLNLSVKLACFQEYQPLAFEMFK